MTRTRRGAALLKVGHLGQALCSGGLGLLVAAVVVVLLLLPEVEVEVFVEVAVAFEGAEAEDGFGDTARSALNEFTSQT